MGGRACARPRRRSAVRGLVRSGVTEKVAMTITGHKTRSVFERYNIISQRDIREAVERREEMLERERDKNVVRPRSAPAAPGRRARQGAVKRMERLGWTR